MRTCSGELKSSAALRLLRPLFSLPIDILWRELNCSSITQASQVVVKPQAEALVWRIFLAASITSGQVVGGWSGLRPAFLNASLL